MSLSNRAERFPSPIFRSTRENRLRFTQREHESPIGDPRARYQFALAAIVLERVRKKLQKHFLEKLRIDIKRPIDLYVPCDLMAVVLKLALDLRAHVSQKFLGRVSHHVRGNIC